MQIDSMLIVRKLDEMTTAMKLENAPPYEKRSIELAYGEAMLLWNCLALRDAIKNIVK